MKLILVHNYYQQPGGEDQVFASESELLKAHGHQVLHYTVHNDTADFQHKLALGVKAVWNQRRFRELFNLFQKIQPNVVHVHNTLPLISPAIYYAARALRIPVCQTLHNYRLLCPNALFFRNDKVCVKCRDRHIAWPGIIHACYRKSRPATMVVALINIVHRLLGTWKNTIDLYIALTKFSKQIFINAGIEKNKIVVKPNFAENPLSLPGNNDRKAREGALFVGRLSREKGVQTLLKAWEKIGNRMPLKIAGNGPLAPYVEKMVTDNSGITWLGQRPHKEIYRLMATSEILIFPSEWYETFGKVAIEAFSQSTPVIASRIGACAEIVDHGRTGLHFEAGNARDLSERVDWIRRHPHEITRMGYNARTEFEAKYTPEKNYSTLMEVYHQTIENHARKQARTTQIQGIYQIKDHLCGVNIRNEI